MEPTLFSGAERGEGRVRLLGLRESQQQNGEGGGSSNEQHKEGEALLNHLSFPPTEEELSQLQTLTPSQLPPKYIRSHSGRVFVNRSLRLDRISWVGFDMDYTLAVYKEPVFEALTYEIALEHMIQIGYPDTIRGLKYDPQFPIRGLFLDSQLGNLLKVDSFGNIIICVHGRKRWKKKKIYISYPGGLIHNDEIGRRFYLLNTLFALPEACLYADLVDHLERQHQSKMRAKSTSRESEGDASSEASDEETLHADNLELSFKNLFQDIRTTIDYIHGEEELKKVVVSDIAKYIHKNEKMPTLLDRLRKGGKKLFLLTNSEFNYTNSVMTYLLGDAGPSWRNYFDVIIVNAKKPHFFAGGTTLRMVDLRTGTLKVGKTVSFEPGQVYSGGSLEIFNKFTNTTSPNSVLYVGDHIFADIIVSKKSQGWRNLLVIRELEEELRIWKENQEKYNRLLTLEWVRAEIFRGLDSQSTESPPDLSHLRKHTREVSSDLDQSFNKYFGSLFRSGSKQSFFSMQVQRYADLYTADYTNLTNYPLFYTFYAPPLYLSHEREYSLELGSC